MINIDQQILELEAQSTTMGKCSDPLESKFRELENNKKVAQEMTKLKEKNSQADIDELRSKIDKL